MGDDEFTHAYSWIKRHLSRNILVNYDCPSSYWAWVRLLNEFILRAELNIYKMFLFCGSVARGTQLSTIYDLKKIQYSKYLMKTWINSIKYAKPTGKMFIFDAEKHLVWMTARGWTCAVTKSWQKLVIWGWQRKGMASLPEHSHKLVPWLAWSDISAVCIT